MPTFNRRNGEPEGERSKWFIRTPGSDHPYTFQVKPKGYRGLLNSGLEGGDDVDWDVFRTLRSLGQLYTLNSSYTPEDAPVPDSFAFDGLSLEQRVQFAVDLLEEYSVQELCDREGPFKFLLSFAEESWEDTQPVLEQILERTPFGAMVVADYQEAFDVHGGTIYRDVEYSAVLLALFIRVAYDALEGMEVSLNSEGYPIWQYDGWIVCAGTELIFYSIYDTVVEAIPELLADAIGEASQLTVGNVAFYEFFEYELGTLSEFQFVMRAQDVNPHLGFLLGEGLGAGRHDYVLMIPGADDSRNGPFHTDYM